MEEIKWIDVHYIHSKKQMDIFVYSKKDELIGHSTHKNKRIQDASILTNMFEILYGYDSELYEYIE